MASYVIFLVTYNRSHKIKQVLESLLNQNLQPRLIFIIDNKSIDSTSHVIKSFNNDKIIYINTEDNLGHCGGLANGISKYLKEYFKDELVMLFEDDSIADKELATYMVHHKQNSDFDLVALDGFKMNIGKRTKPELNSEMPIAIDFALLDGCIFHSSLLKMVGLPIQNWFMMYDDVEYSYRIRKKGFKIGAVKNIYHQIEHLGASSATWRAYYQSRNHVHFVRRHFNLTNLLDLIIMELKRTIMSIGTKKFKLHCKGIIDGVRGIYGKSLEIK